MTDKIEWCINKHKETNHFYDTYLPYEFHLRMVVKVSEQFKQYIPFQSKQGWTLGLWGHDLIEDTRCSYNDVLNELGLMAADIIYAVTNDKGKNRKERAGEKYYEGIRNTYGATFVKLCDRIANIQYSKMTGSKMFEMYKKENQQFVQYLYTDELILMFDYLDSLLNS